MWAGHMYGINFIVVLKYDILVLYKGSSIVDVLCLCCRMSHPVGVGGCWTDRASYNIRSLPLGQVPGFQHYKGT